MKKIALVRSTYSPYGGVERVARSIVEGLLKRGVGVTLLTFPGQPWPMEDANLEVVTLGHFRTHRLLQAWSFERAVVRYLKRQAFDCIFSLDKVTRFTHLHAGGGTHKTFLRIRSEYSNPLSRLFRRFSLFHRYTLYLEKKGFENPALRRVRCNAEMVKKDIQNDYGVSDEKLCVIHSGIRWQEMEPVFDDREAVGDRLRRQHGIDPQWQCLLFLGSGFDRKGLDIAIRGVASLPPTCHLLVVGKGATAAYESLAASLDLADRVHFLGSQPQGWRYAACCRALVLPSRYDPFGGAAAEGHAMGVPVLVSDTTGFADYVVPGDNGVILRNPMTETAIRSGFAALWDLIRNPKRSSDELREHVSSLDDDAILERLLTEFLPL